MRRNRHNEDWKQRKEYLIRSLFEEVPRLSPVPEAEESCSQSIGLPYSYEIRKPTDVLPSTIESRPYSPLPPLVIEREPNRHDEPEVYYQHLEVKMRKLYKRMFTEGCSASSSLPDIDDGTENLSNGIEHFDHDVQMEIRKISNDETNNSDEYNINDTSESEHEELIEFEKQINNSDNDQDNPSEKDATILRPVSEHTFDILEVQGNKNNEPKLNSSSSTESSREHFQKITFEAQVHREDNVADIEKQSVVYESAERNDLTCADLREDGDERDQERTDLFEDGDDNQVPSLSEESNITGPPGEETQEIEIMRTTRIHPSEESLQNELCNKMNSVIFSTESRKTRKRTLEICSPSVMIGDNTMDINRCSDDFSQMLPPSAPKIKRKSRTNDEITSTSQKRKSFEDVAVQVSEKSRWSSLRGNFFVGSPEIFRLCSCKNHSCHS